jgi:hypothetical protein
MKSTAERIRLNNKLSAVCFFLEEIVELCLDEDDIAFLRGYANQLVKPDADFKRLLTVLDRTSGFAFTESDLWKVTSHINTIKSILKDA